ncbi:MAG TPA: hypothetical protein VGM59_03590 [Dongiaceae bacterium]|jgi:hypothetical protein
MSTETRKIIFSTEEVIQAVSKHRRDEKQPLPESRIRGMKTEDGVVPKFVLQLEDRGDGKTGIELRPAEIAVALIKFCRLKRIPLPKRADKSLALDDGHVTLILFLDNG